MFQPAVPVAKLLQGVHNSEYVLPAIQREFVWDTDQICALFDSLMRGYPIGSFLFWKVEPAEAERYTFYDFITNYHEKDAPYAPEKYIPKGQGATAILDGQQRLTALNIGLYGSHAERLPRMHWSNPKAYPKKRLHLNLLAPPIGEQKSYDFQFLTVEEAKPVDDEPNGWFPVSDVLSFANSGPQMFAALKDRGLGETEPFEVLDRLFTAVKVTPSINAFLEEEQDPDRVLDIFVRVNSGGTQLSYSDLLLSMATNQWTELNAREEVRTLVTEMKGMGDGFAFSKDLVLKTGLVLIDVPDVGFKVSNFTQANMAAMETAWPDIRAALLTAVNLFDDFGYDSRTLTADSVLIPIAYYIYKRKLGSTYLVSSHDAHDRKLIRDWVARSLMKRGIWGSGLDSLLRSLRDAIRDHGATGFPVDALEAAMPAGKSLKFNDDEVNELLDLTFGNKRVFPVLAALYPGLDFTKTFHVDHIFPRSRFTKAKLAAAGVPAESIDEFISKVNGLANLQLLQGTANVEKQAVLPAEWLHGPHFTSDAARTQYVTDNDLHDLPDDIAGFGEFYDRRRDALETRLRQALGVS